MVSQCYVCLLCSLWREIQCASDILCVKDRVKRFLPLCLMLLAGLSGESDTLRTTQTHFYQSGLSRLPGWQKLCLKCTPSSAKTQEQSSPPAHSFRSTKTRSFSEVSWRERDVYLDYHISRGKHASLSQFRIGPIGQKSFCRVDKLIKNSEGDDNRLVFFSCCTIIAFHAQYLWEGGVIVYPRR